MPSLGYWMASELPRLLDTALKFALFSLSGLKDEKLIKKSKPTWKPKHANSILESFKYFCQISSKLILAILSYRLLFQSWCIFWGTVYIHRTRYVVFVFHRFSSCLITAVKCCDFATFLWRCSVNNNVWYVLSFDNIKRHLCLCCVSVLQWFTAAYLS